MNPFEGLPVLSQEFTSNAIPEKIPPSVSTSAPSASNCSPESRPTPTSPLFSKPANWAWIAAFMESPRAKASSVGSKLGIPGRLMTPVGAAVRSQEFYYARELYLGRSRRSAGQRRALLAVGFGREQSRRDVS